MNTHSHSVPDEIRYRLLHYLEGHPEATQRELARHLGISIGKVNYCLRALIEKGWLKMRNFRNSNNKLSYAYHLTPNGLEEKINVTAEFLRRKMAEYDALSEEIERLSREVAASARPDRESSTSA
ncbi:MAG TPA: MarR family EPS-associated transcriptional regulator [Thermoanaerobaculia bacterium]